MDETDGFVIDDEHAIGPLSDLGWQVSTVSWRQTQTAWSEFDVVIIRSTWDYMNDVPFFLDTLERIDRQSLLANRLDLIQWNLAGLPLRLTNGHVQPEILGKKILTVTAVLLNSRGVALARGYCLTRTRHQYIPVVSSSTSCLVRSW